MGRPEECATLILEGYTPSQVAMELGLSVNSVIPYLYRAMGNRQLTQSDIVLSIPKDTRTALESLIAARATTDLETIMKEATARGVGVNRDDLGVYLHLRSTYIGDLYFYVTELERTLHALLRRVLAREASVAGLDWWQAVPEKVRQECENRLPRGRVSRPHPYSLTTFYNLVEIIHRKWSLFAVYLPEAEVYDRTRLVEDLHRANRVRNQVMHPVERDVVADSEFRHVMSLASRLDSQRWRLPEDMNPSV